MIALEPREQKGERISNKYTHGWYIKSPHVGDTLYVINTTDKLKPSQPSYSLRERKSGRNDVQPGGGRDIFG